MFEIAQILFVLALQKADVTVAVTVDPNANRRAISPLIYGVNFGDQDQAEALRWPVRRWGGNGVTRYSWQDDIANHASDWFFYNIESGPDPGTLPDGSAADVFIDQTRQAGAEPIMTVPLIGWTPIDRVRRWGFSVSKYGPQEQTECTATGFPPWCEPDAGNGNHPNGSPITGNDPHDTSREIGPDFVTGWMAHIAGRVGTASQGGPRFFALDNEPDLWNSTHRDVHPTPLSYDEIWQRTVDYASAIKTQDAGALVLGPVPWGWCAYFWSALDGCGDGGPDLAAHGGVHYLEWYLQQAHDYELANGVRLVDYLDIHYYPQASSVALSDDESAGTSALRLRSLKSLYDPDYVDESWIGSCCGAAVQLIPRMKAWIGQRYPGTKLAITEYNWGGDDGASSALAQAEVLAIFGREGVELATRWVSPAPDTRVEDAFRIYRDYDGTGSSVSGDSVSAVSANVDELGAYAVAGTGTHLFLLLFNKATAARDAAITSASPFHWRSRLWRFDPSAPLGSAGTVLPAGGGLTLTLPARSATLAVTILDFADVPPPHPFYSFVMTVADDGVSAGCGGMSFCPDSAVTRAQMAVFLLKSKLGANYTPPPATGTVFGDVASGGFAADWIEDLFARGITGGCQVSPPLFCPGQAVTRAEMAVFLLKALLSSGYAPPPAQYIFVDVPVDHFAIDWIEDLYVRQITGGCSAMPLAYCPEQPNTRGQMAVFLTKTFALP